MVLLSVVKVSKGRQRCAQVLLVTASEISFLLCTAAAVVLLLLMILCKM